MRFQNLGPGTAAVPPILSGIELVELGSVQSDSALQDWLDCDDSSYGRVDVKRSAAIKKPLSNSKYALR